MVHIEIHSGRASIIEASGQYDTVAGEITAAVGVIYANLCNTGTDIGEGFREAITSMLSDKSSVWEESHKVNTGVGASIVFAPPTRAEG